ncbi:hypothetical protein THAOC_36082 [Thalassiosira oceanica]|uniref:Uncharacterized protein n=1 Tax=Thalassiosira oceanica TaxID=159749 RepID=K0RFH0_THAOC|nr:hypothetical protein THAOC_36082 [Thalassiosira oceanica]|eukprot:EJK45307.1 hypothetical protein THAOC_36082 [Thalassiosira oceanica]
MVRDYQTNCVEASSTTCASALEYGYPINCWQVQAITNFRQLFNRMSNFNEDISAWDVSSVTNFDGTFFQAAQFNQPIGAWNVSSGVSFEYMFHITYFNQPLNDWDVSQATSLKDMFYAANAFNQPLDKWDVSKVSSNHFHTIIVIPSAGIELMLRTTKVENFQAMFINARQFNQPLHEWDVSSGTNFLNMFGLEGGQSATAPRLRSIKTFAHGGSTMTAPIPIPICFSTLAAPASLPQLLAKTTGVSLTATVQSSALSQAVRRSTLNPTGSPTKAPSVTIPMDLIFDQVNTNFGVKTPSNFTPGDGDIGVPSYDDMISTFTIGKGLDVHMFLFQKDCYTEVSKSLYTRTETRADVSETHQTLTVDYNFVMDEISSSSIWNETSSTIEVCQTAKLMVDGGAEYGDLVIKEDTRIVEIEFDLTTEFNITSELTGATIDTLDEYADVDGAIYACKCGGLENYTCNTDELTPNEALYVCISTVEPTFEIENLESMTIIQGQTQMDIVKSGAVRPALANGIADRRQKSDDTGVAVTTLIPINLFDFQAGASVSVIGQINMKLASKRSDLFGRSLRANPARLEYEVSVDLKESDPEVPNSAQLDSDALNGVSDFDSFGSDFHALNEMSDFDSASVLSGSVLAILAFGIGAALL